MHGWPRNRAFPESHHGCRTCPSSRFFSRSGPMSGWLDRILGRRSFPWPTPPAQKLQLKEVTLLLYNPEKDPDLSARVINHVCAGIEFGAIVHLAGKRPTVTHPGQWTKVAPATLWQGQRFQALELACFRACVFKAFFKAHFVFAPRFSRLYRLRAFSPSSLRVFSFFLCP